MKPRLTAWLLTMLLSMAGGFGVPAAGTAIPRASYSVVWPDHSADKSTPQREIAEMPESVPPQPADSQPFIALGDARARVSFLDQSLFQRPPPLPSSRP